MIFCAISAISATSAVKQFNSVDSQISLQSENVSSDFRKMIKSPSISFGSRLLFTFQVVGHPSDVVFPQLDADSLDVGGIECVVDFFA